MKPHTLSPIHNFNKKSSGFTLIELLVSVAIMMLIVGVGLASYITFNEKQQLSGAAKELQTYLRSAQTRARSGDVPTDCGTLSGYQVVMSQGESVVTITAVCSGTNSSSEHTLPGGVAAANGIDMTFSVLKGGVTGAQDVSLTLGSRSYTFEVTQGGEISQGGIDDVQVVGASPSPTATIIPTPSPLDEPGFGNPLQ